MLKMKFFLSNIVCVVILDLLHNKEIRFDIIWKWCMCEYYEYINLCECH